MSIFSKYFVHIAFLLVGSYFAFLAFVLETEPMKNKMFLLLVACLWCLWFFMKSLLKTLIGLCLLGGAIYAGYYIMNQDQIECEKSGKEWNEKLKVCEEKKGLMEKVSSNLKSTVKVWLSKNVKMEKTDKPKEAEDEK